MYVKRDVPPEFGELVVLSWTDACAVSISACENVLPVQILQVAETVFCFAPSIEPSPLLVGAALLPAYVAPLPDAADLQLPSVAAPASGLGGFEALTFVLLSWCHYSCCSLWIPSLLAEVLVNGTLKITRALRWAPIVPVWMSGPK